MTSPRRSRRWILFFAVLALLAAAAVALEIWFNLQQQLTPARLEQARARWQGKGPPSYDLQYTVARQSRAADRLLARVRDGALTAVEADGEPLDPDLYPFYDLPGLLAAVERDQADSPGVRNREVGWIAPAVSSTAYEVAVRRGQVVRAEADHHPLPPEVRDSYDMAGLFAGVVRLLERDTRAGGWRIFNVAMFDPDDSRLEHYVRSNTGTRARLEFNLLDFKPVVEARAAP
jgi:hypothetical protein